MIKNIKVKQMRRNSQVDAQKWSSRYVEMVEQKRRNGGVILVEQVRRNRGVTGEQEYFGQLGPPLQGQKSKIKTEILWVFVALTGLIDQKSKIKHQKSKADSVLQKPNIITYRNQN